MAKLVKLADVAQVVGVSAVTVSKALAGKSGVSEELRDKIKQIADEMGYISLSASKSSVSQNTGNIGIVLAAHFLDVPISFYWKLYQHVISRLSEKNYFAILEIISTEAEKNIEIPNIIKEEKVDGIVVIGQMQKPYADYLIRKTDIPVFFLDSYFAVDNYDTVISDGFLGTYLLTSHLIENGHRDIAFLGTIKVTSSITDRYFGYYKALLENNIPFRPEWIIPDREENGNNLEDYELPDELPTAFVCNCDLTANNLILQLEFLGMNVPEDISVVGFDNYTHRNRKLKKVTTYEVEMSKMAEVCVESLLKKIAGCAYPKGIQVIPGKLLCKETVRKRS